MYLVAKGKIKMQPIIFVDMDGVLVDLVKGLSERVGKELSYSRKEEFNTEFYNFINNVDRAHAAQFWSKLPPTPDCEKIWNAVKGYKAKILTSVSGKIGAVYGKELWCWTNLGINSDYVYCSEKSYKKQLYASKNSLLIDDYSENIEQWRNAGGTAIHHVDADSTIQQFKDYISKTWKYDCY
jgi:FMN phosphatase YigB (HAD superfamily)